MSAVPKWIEEKEHTKRVRNFSAAKRDRSKKRPHRAFSRDRGLKRRKTAPSSRQNSQLILERIEHHKAAITQWLGSTPTIDAVALTFATYTTREFMFAEDEWAKERHELDDMRFGFAPAYITPLKLRLESDTSGRIRCPLLNASVTIPYVPHPHIHRGSYNVVDHKVRGALSDYTIDGFRSRCQSLTLTPALFSESALIAKEGTDPRWKWSTISAPCNTVLLEDEDQGLHYYSRLKTYLNTTPSVVHPDDPTETVHWCIGIIRLRLVENYMHHKIFPVMSDIILRETPLIDVLIRIIIGYLPSGCVVSQTHGSVVDDDQPISQEGDLLDIVRDFRLPSSDFYTECRLERVADALCPKGKIPVPAHQS